MDTEVIEGDPSLYSFTPVRRRESTINTRQFQGDQAQEWTAARCHRLLRALTSRVAILNKELGRFSSVIQNEKDQVRENSRAAKRTKTTRAGADWVQARKRIRQTYSKKSSRTENDPRGTARQARGLPSMKGRKSLVPGEIAVPTPILARARGEPLAEEASLKVPDARVLEEPARRNKRSRTRYLANDGESHFHLSESLLELPRRITASRYEGIYSGLEALLRATTTNGLQPKRTGAHSLLSMSLRAIPRYITQQEALLQAHVEKTGSKSAIENRDIATEIYDELETLGSCGIGWKRLRTVVRSHGIQVVSDAIGAGLLDVEFSGALIALCVNTSAIDEAQTLLSTLLTLAPFPGPKTPYDIPCRPLVMLWRFAEHTGRYSFQYRQLSDMVSNGILPVEWLATKEFSPVWARIVHSLAPSSDNIEPMNFLDLTLTMLSVVGTSAVPETHGSVIEAAKNTFSSLLTILLSVVLLSRGAETSDPTKQSGCSYEYEHVSSLLQSSLAKQSHSNAAFDRPSPLLLLANLFVHGLDGIMIDLRDSLLRCLLPQLMQQDASLARPSLMYSSAVDFICLVARCCGQGTSTSGFEHLQHLHLLVESFIHDIEGGNILKGLIVDSALAFAQNVPDRKHIDYATVMDERFCARRFGDEDSLLAGPTTDCEEPKTGFRWEEGIGEWVTATPAIPIVRRRLAEASSDSESDTPLQRPKVRQMKRLSKKANVNPSSLCTDRYVDLSDVSVEGAKEALDELGSCHESDRSRSSPESNDGSADHSQSFSLLLSDESTSSTSDVEVSSIDTSYVSNNLPPAIAPDGPSFGKCHEVLDRVPRLSRRLFRGTQDWNLFDDDSSDSASPSLPHDNSESEFQRDYIDRAPRLGRRALRSSQAWEIFDESDDELSFHSVSSQREQVLHDITNTTVSSTRRLRKANPPPKQRPSFRSPASHTDSEDELCI
ncbi:uncharacterized protein K444DRAFT_664643 [Hyaloscypha bicolor E]|uniref:Uncharacterized protein n=1 Tax=Hyaloscypha bicolor E TaxID=1095630 RepID=A0A2J6T536_9HELO|nr:uncharacterized protein K444DRAFT_664643 [Hyaloscypha bicolor E]PMD58139.1 hypothetical protein K444DRAFT_664643 [Hyaloscypha bicolor E]